MALEIEDLKAEIKQMEAELKAVQKSHRYINISNDIDFVSIRIRIQSPAFWTGILKPSHGSHTNWKMGENFPVRENQGVLGRLEKSGNLTQNIGNVREF